MGKKISDYLVEYFPKDLAEIIIQYGYKWYGVCEYTIKDHGYYILCLAMLPSSDGEYLISGSSDKTVKIWSTKTYECTKTLIGHTNSVYCVAVLSEKLVASGSEDNTLILWNTKTNDDDALIATLKGHTRSVYSVVFISEKLLVSSSHDQTLKIWNIETKSCVLTLTGHTYWINSCVVLSNDPINSTIRIMSGAGNGIIKIWTIKNKNDEKLSLICYQDIIDHEQCVLLKIFMYHAYKIDTTKIITTTHKSIQIRNAKTFECERTIYGHSDWIRCIAMLPDGRIVSGSDDDKLKIWNIDDNKLKIWNIDNNNDRSDLCDINLEGHTHNVANVVVLSDGRIASCSWDSTIKIWH